MVTSTNRSPSDPILAAQYNALRADLLTLLAHTHAATTVPYVLADTVSDGVADDAAAVQAAIDALPAAGGVVCLKPGRCRIATGLAIGNGSSAAPSTRKHVTLLGTGNGATEAEINGRNGATELSWDGAAGGTMLTINGPIAGVRIEGIGFDAQHGSTAAATVIRSKHVLNSTFRRLTIERWTGVAVDVDAYENPTGCADGADDVTWDNVNVLNPGSVTAVGLRLGGDSYASAPHLNVARHLFLGGQFWGGSAGGVGIELRFCDAITFVQTATDGDVGVRVSVPSGSTTFPGAVWFYNCPTIGDADLVGTWAGAHPVTFWPYPTGDGETIPTANCYEGVTSTGVRFTNSGVGEFEFLAGAGLSPELRLLRAGVASASVLSDAGGRLTLYDMVNARQLAVFELGYVDMGETTEPIAPGADRGRLWFEDNGAGKTRLVCKFATGAKQVLATQP